MEFKPRDSDSKYGWRNKTPAVQAMQARKALAQFVQQQGIQNKGKVRTRAVRRFNNNLVIGPETARESLTEAQTVAKTALDKDDEVALLAVYDALCYYN